MNGSHCHFYRILSKLHDIVFDHLSVTIFIILVYCHQTILENIEKNVEPRKKVIKKLAAFKKLRLNKSTR